MLQDGRVVAEGAAAAYLQAELTPIVTVGSTAALTVRLVRADAAADPGAAADLARTAAATHGMVTVTVVPRGLRFLVGARRSRRLRLPADGSGIGSAEARFTMLAVDRGPAEVTVLVRGDGELPLASVRLTSEVVASDDHDQAGLARASARIAPADAVLSRRPTLRIDEEVARGRSILNAALFVGGETHEFRVRLADKAHLVRRVHVSLARAKSAGDGLSQSERARSVERGLREVGAELTDRLLDRRARELLWTHRDELDGLVVQTTGETELPWELLVVRRPGSAPSESDPFLGQFGLTRWLYDVAHPAAVRLATMATDGAPPRPATAIASSSVVALGSGTGGATDGGAAEAMRNGAGVVVECGGTGGRSPLSETFLATFSAELAEGSPVDRASRRAREAARAAGEACALAYAVYGHPEARARAA